MTAVFKLTDSATIPMVIDFLAGPLYMDRAKWSPAPTFIGANYQPVGIYGLQPKYGKFDAVKETFEVWASDATNEITQELVKFDQLMEKARAYWEDPLNVNPVYLIVQYEDEEAARQVLITNGWRSDISTRMAPAMMQPTTTQGKYVINLFRHPFWEMPQSAVQAFTGITWASPQKILNYMAGTAPARISQLDIQVESSPYTIKKLWVGLLNQRVNVQAFTATFDLTDSTGGAVAYGDAVYEADTYALNGSAYKVTFATHAELYPRIYHNFLAAISPTSNRRAYYGKYRVLLRYRLSDASTLAGIQLQNLNIVNQEIYNLGGDTNYHVVDLGEIQYPINAPESSTETPPAGFLEFYAERLSGSGNLYIDSFMVMPSERLWVEGYAYCTLSTDALRLMITPRDIPKIKMLSSGVEAIWTFEPSVNDFYYYPGYNYLVVAFEGTNGHVLSHSVKVDFSHCYRWRSVMDLVTETPL